MLILITGANGFIGSHIKSKLNKTKEFSTLSLTREDSRDSLQKKINKSDLIIHLAGVNRPTEVSEFDTINVGLTESICQFVQEKNTKTPIIFGSSTQALLDNPYGQSKYSAETLFKNLSSFHGSPVAILRLPGVFGQFCKPNYNSVIATFCYNIANNLPIIIDNPAKLLSVVYIDDVINQIINLILYKFNGCSYPIVKPEYSISLGDIAKQIKTYKDCNKKLNIDGIDENFSHALFATYLSYLP
jgi:UDP-2-acetamido-2,6-beta-L-arabino-hexul-4-ose reductase